MRTLHCIKSTSRYPITDFVKLAPKMLMHGEKTYKRCFDFLMKKNLLVGEYKTIKTFAGNHIWLM